MAKDKQVPTGEGVKDIPAVPSSLHGNKTPALGSVGDVPASGGHTNKKVS